MQNALKCHAPTNRPRAARPAPRAPPLTLLVGVALALAFGGAPALDAGDVGNMKDVSRRSTRDGRLPNVPWEVIECVNTVWGLAL